MCIMYDEKFITIQLTTRVCFFFAFTTSFSFIYAANHAQTFPPFFYLLDVFHLIFTLRIGA